MFRAAHSLKGLSGMLRLDNVNGLTHRMENLLDAARNLELTVTAETVDVFFKAVDRLEGMIDALRAEEEDAGDSQEVIEAIERMLAREGVLKQQASAEEIARRFAQGMSEASSSAAATKSATPAGETPTKVQVATLPPVATVVTPVVAQVPAAPPITLPPTLARTPAASTRARPASASAKRPAPRTRSWIVRAAPRSTPVMSPCRRSSHWSRGMKWCQASSSLRVERLGASRGNLRRGMPMGHIAELFDSARPMNTSRPLLKVSSRRGLLMRARPMASICCWPPDNVPAGS